MKKTKLLTSLTSLVAVSAATPIVATSCSYNTGSITAVDGSNIWYVQSGEMKTLLAKAKDGSIVTNAKWTIKNTDKLRYNLGIISNLYPIGAAIPFGCLYLVGSQLDIPSEGISITVHAENTTKTVNADLQILIKMLPDASAKLQYNVVVDDAYEYEDYKKLVYWQTAGYMNTEESSIGFEALKNNKAIPWKWDYLAFELVTNQPFTDLIFEEDMSQAGKAYLSVKPGTKIYGDIIVICYAKMPNADYSLTRLVWIQA